jgi:uncharacterized tellurite resistance protein B-like protein
MFTALRRLLKSGAAAPEPDRVSDPKVATAALLVEAALTDGVYANVEQAAILTVIRDAFEIDEDEAREVLREAEPQSEQAVDAWRFTTIVKTLPLETRLKVIGGLYQVAHADGEACKFEDAFIRHVASLLHIEDVDRAHARRDALGDQG